MKATIALKIAATKNWRQSNAGNLTPRLPQPNYCIYFLKHIENTVTPLVFIAIMEGIGLLSSKHSYADLDGPCVSSYQQLKPLQG